MTCSNSIQFCKKRTDPFKLMPLDETRKSTHRRINQFPQPINPNHLSDQRYLYETLENMSKKMLNLTKTLAEQKSATRLDTVETRIDDSTARLESFMISVSKTFVQHERYLPVTQTLFNENVNECSHTPFNGSGGSYRRRSRES